MSARQSKPPRVNIAPYGVSTELYENLQRIRDQNRVDANLNRQLRQARIEFERNRQIQLAQEKQQRNEREYQKLLRELHEEDARLTRLEQEAFAKQAERNEMAQRLVDTAAAISDDDVGLLESWLQEMRTNTTRGASARGQQSQRYDYTGGTSISYRGSSSSSSREQASRGRGRGTSSRGGVLY